MKFLKFLFVLFFISGIPVLAQQPLRNQFTTNQSMNAVQDGWSAVWNAIAGRWSNANVAGLGGDAGGTNSRQGGSLVLTNLTITGVPWTTNIPSGSDIAITLSNMPNNALVYLTPGTYTITPHIASSNGFGGINIFNKTNITIVGYGSTINGHSAVGESLYITNSSNIRWYGSTFDGLVVTNFTLAPTNRQYAGISYYACRDLLFDALRIINHHNFGLRDLACNNGGVQSTNNIVIRDSYFYNCGSQFTNAPIIADGSGIEITGATVEGCMFQECLRGIEIYADFGAPVFRNTIVRNNTFVNTLHSAIFTSGSTNCQYGIVQANSIFNEPGFTRRGTNYFTDGCGIELNGGIGWRVLNNNINGFPYTGILVGGVFPMSDIMVNDNAIRNNFGTVSIGYGIAFPGSTPVTQLQCNNNSISETFTYGLYILYTRNSSFCGNKIYRPTTLSNFSGIILDASGNSRSTNAVLTGNTIIDDTGNMNYGIKIVANNTGIVLGANRSIGHTSDSVNNNAGSGAIYYGQDSFNYFRVSSRALFGNAISLSDEMELNAYNGKFGFSNVFTGMLSLYMPDNQNGDDWTMPGNLGVANEAYNATTWNGSTNVPTKDAIRDKIESLGSGGTNFSGIELTNAINQAITNATGTSVTADWNGPTWLRLNLSGTTTISFTNTPALIASKGKIFLLELYASGAAPAVTFQNIDDRPISWRGIGSPVLIDTLTNFFTVRFDGTNFIGESHQDRTTGLIDSPVVLAYHNVQSNANFKGTTIFTNQPGDGSPTIRLAQTNSQAYYELSTLPDWKTTNRWILATTNEAAGEVLKIQATSVSGGIRTTIWTNGVDGGGSGSPAGTDRDLQFNDGGAFGGTNALEYIKGTYSINFTGVVPSMVMFDLGGSGASNRLTTTGLRAISQTDLRFGVNNADQWKIDSASATVGDFIPVTDDANNAGTIATSVKNLYLSRQLVSREAFLGGNIAATNIDFSRYSEIGNDTNLVVDATYALTNVVGVGRMGMFLIGQTNGATNHTITFTAAGGATINHMAGTNGPSAFTLYSNSIAHVSAKVYTNLTGTNIVVEWKSDSFWPQRMAQMIGSAGGSTSNFFAGGTIYFDYNASSLAYTNSTNNFSYTNLATVMLPANLLTNLGDSITATWRGRFTGARNGTNQLIGGIGTVTNGLGDTGQFTNRANAAWQYVAEVTCTGPTNHSCYWQFNLGGATTLTGNITNFQTGSFDTGIVTNGVTNVIYLQVSSRGNAAVTNDYFRVDYKAGIR